MQVTEIYNFDQNDLMTEDIFILDCHSDIFVWVGQQVNSKYRKVALTIGEVRFYLILSRLKLIFSFIKLLLNSKPLEV